MKMLLNRTMSNSKNLYLLNTHIKKNPIFLNKSEKNLNTIIMKHYNTQRNLNNLTNYNKTLLDEDNKDTKILSYLKKKMDLKEKNLKILNSEFEKFLVNDFLINSTICIESICNSLFLMSAKNLKNLKNENFFLESLKKKGFENLTFGNILDIFCFLAKTKNPLWKENEDLFLEVLNKKIQEIKNMQIVGQNGNSINFFQLEENQENIKYSEIVKNLKNEQNLIKNVHFNLLNKEELYLEKKISLMNLNYYYFSNIFENLRTGVFDYPDDYFEVSYLQEFRRLGYLLSVWDQEKVKKSWELLKNY